MRSGPPFGPGGRIVNSSKPSSDSWLASSTVLTTLYSNAMSAFKHRASSGQLAQNPNARRGPDDGRPRHSEEEPVLHNAGKGMESRAEAGVDRTEGRVQDQVAVVGPERLPGCHAELRLPAQGLDRAAGRLPEEGQHFDRHRSAPETADQLAFVSDQDETPAGMRHDLLP